MDFPTVQARLNDLPRTFLRQDANFQNIQSSLTAGLVLETLAADGETAQIQSLQNAQFGWVDTWGLLFDIPRLANEADQHYINRIIYTLNAGAGPPVAIAYWCLIVWGLQVTVQENLPTVGYSITFPGGITQTQLAQIVQSLARIRPAGVPFTVVGQGTGLYMSTINFMDTPDVTGGWLTGGSAVSGLIGAATNNSPVLLPTTMLTDPQLNGANSV